MCVQDVDVQCALQFTLIHAASCALHRRTSRVIHRIELSDLLFGVRGPPKGNFLSVSDRGFGRLCGGVPQRAI